MTHRSSPNVLNSFHHIYFKLYKISFHSLKNSGCSKQYLLYIPNILTLCPFTICYLPLCFDFYILLFIFTMLIAIPACTSTSIIQNILSQKHTTFSAAFFVLLRSIWIDDLDPDATNVPCNISVLLFAPPLQPFLSRFLCALSFLFIFFLLPCLVSTLLLRINYIVAWLLLHYGDFSVRALTFFLMLSLCLATYH